MLGPLTDKGRADIRGELSGYGPAPPLARGREAGGQHPEPERGKISPKDSILYQTAIRLPVAYQVFLGSWMVDIYQEGCSQRSAPQKRHIAHLRRRSHCTPGKPSSWDKGGDKMHCTPGESALTKHLVA